MYTAKLPLLARLVCTRELATHHGGREVLAERSLQNSLCGMVLWTVRYELAHGSLSERPRRVAAYFAFMHYWDSIVQYVYQQDRTAAHHRVEHSRGVEFIIPAHYIFHVSFRKGVIAMPSLVPADHNFFRVCSANSIRGRCSSPPRTTFISL